MADPTKIDDVVEYMLTTVDNPFNPFNQWDEWLTYDTAKGYHTPSILARIVKSSDDLSEADQALAIQSAIQEVCDHNVLGLYRKVSKDFKNS